VHRVIERTQINQAKLVIGYRTPVSGAHPLYYPALLFSTVLGGTPSSRLFNRIREQESLCYYVQSKFDRFKGMLIVTAGIDKTSDARATELVDEVFKDMLEGQITQDELENARKSIVSGLRSITDYPNSYSNFLFSQWMTEETLDIELIIQKLNAVEIEEVTSAGRLFVKDTWYLLTGEENQ
jgi:predicted Zn-dependent peptidase